MKVKEQAIVKQINGYKTLYDFSSVRLIKRIRMALAIIMDGGFTFTGKEKTKNKLL